MGGLWRVAAPLSGYPRQSRATRQSSQITPSSDLCRVGSLQGNQVDKARADLPQARPPRPAPCLQCPVFAGSAPARPPALGATAPESPPRRTTAPGGTRRLPVTVHAMGEGAATAVPRLSPATAAAARSARAPRCDRRRWASSTSGWARSPGRTRRPTRCGPSRPRQGRGASAASRRGGRRAIDSLAPQDGLYSHSSAAPTGTGARRRCSRSSRGSSPRRGVGPASPIPRCTSSALTITERGYPRDGEGGWRGRPPTSAATRPHRARAARARPAGAEAGGEAGGR